MLNAAAPFLVGNNEYNAAVSPAPAVSPALLSSHLQSRLDCSLHLVNCMFVGKIMCFKSLPLLAPIKARALELSSLNKATTATEVSRRRAFPPPLHKPDPPSGWRA